MKSLSADQRIVDGAVVAVDCIEGCALHTMTVLRQALTERAISGSLHSRIAGGAWRHVHSILKRNQVIATYNDAFLCDVQVGFVKATVAFNYLFLPVPC